MNEKYDLWLARATEIGREHGENAAAWWEQDAIGGRASGDVTAAARRVLAGIEDCDPMILDNLPAPDLSGEWAGGYTPDRLYEDCDVDAASLEAALNLDNELCDAYDVAFGEACDAAIVKACRLVLDQ